MATTTHPAIEAMNFDEKNVVFEALLDRMTVLGQRAAVYGDVSPHEVARIERDRDVCRAVIASLFSEDAAQRSLAFFETEIGPAAS